MRSDFLDSEDLCSKITDLLEQDSVELSKSLRGDILDEYRNLMQAELEKMAELRKLLQRAGDALHNN